MVLLSEMRLKRTRQDEGDEGALAGEPNPLTVQLYPLPLPARSCGSMPPPPWGRRLSPPVQDGDLSGQDRGRPPDHGWGKEIGEGKASHGHPKCQRHDGHCLIRSPTKLLIHYISFLLHRRVSALVDNRRAVHVGTIPVWRPLPERAGRLGSTDASTLRRAAGNRCWRGLASARPDPTGAGPGGPVGSGPN